MSNTVNAIELQQVNCSFGDFAISDLSFCLPSGCILGLVGENGAGKSTTLRLIMNTQRRDGGRISVLGVDNTDPQFRQVKEDIGVVLDDAYFPEVLSVRELKTVLKNTYRNWEPETFQSYLERFELSERKAFKNFSRGMRMKLAIAAALSHRPRLLLLDEATAGLDPMVRDEILTVFAEFTRSEDHSILICSHIVSDLEKLCDYVAFLHRGKLQFWEEKDRLIESFGLWSCTPEQLAELDPAAVAGREDSPYGVRALLRRDLVPEGLALERPSLEDIVLLQVKGEKRK